MPEHDARFDAHLAKVIVGLGIPSGSVALDLGSGPGRIMGMLRNVGLEPHGCEIDDARAEAARQLGLDVATTDALLWQPPVPARLVTCIELIEHLERPGQRLL